MSKVKSNNLDEPELTPLKNVYLSLRNDKLVTSQADFGRKTKYNAVHISEMLRGKKPIPYRFLKIIYKKYGININYIVSDGKDGPMYLKNADYSLKNATDQLQKENDMLKEVIQDKDKIIHLLEKQKP